MKVRGKIGESSDHTHGRRLGGEFWVDGKKIGEPNYRMTFLRKKIPF